MGDTLRDRITNWLAERPPRSDWRRQARSLAAGGFLPTGEHLGTGTKRDLRHDKHIDRQRAGLLRKEERDDHRP
jgi:hypothetical protein